MLHPDCSLPSNLEVHDQHVVANVMEDQVRFVDMWIVQRIVVDLNLCIRSTDVIVDPASKNRRLENIRVIVVSQTAYERCDECRDERTCGLRLVMKDVRDATARILDNTSLSDVLERISSKKTMSEVMFHI